MPEPPGRVDPRSEAKPDVAGVDRGRIDSGRAHQGDEPRLGRAGETSQAGGDEPAVLVDERHDVRNGREGDEIEMLPKRLVPDESLRELVDDTGAAELREGVRRRTGDDERAIGQLLTGTMVVRDDDVEPELSRARNLVDGSDSTVDRHHEPEALLGNPCERLLGDAVPLLEAAREMPLDIGSELAQDDDRKRRRADAVDVVVAVDADPCPGRNRVADHVARRPHVTERVRVVRDGLGGEEGSRLPGVAVPSPDENARGRLADRERFRKRLDLLAGARTERPGALEHIVQP